MNKPRVNKKTIVAAVAVAALAGTGAAVAASELGGPQASKAIISDAASQLGVTEQKLTDALEQATESRIDEAVEAGTLTEDQAQQLKDRIESGDVPLVGVPMHGPGGHGGPGGMFGGLEAAATYLGVTEEELRTQLEDGQTLAEVATASGKTVDGLKQALTAAATEKLAQALTDGRITQAQADERLADLDSRIDGMVNNPMPAGRGFGGPGHGHGHGPGGFRGLDAAATYLGVTEDELRTQLEDGQTLAEVATASGKTVDGLKQALTAAAEERLAQEVTDGRITQAQADERLADLASRIDDMVNKAMPAPPDGGPPPADSGTTSNTGGSV